MKITFAGTTLADDAALLWCDGDQLDASRETVADDLPGAAYQGRRDLGNASVEYGFRASKEHASIREAEVYYLTHGQGVIGQGEAVLSTVQSKAIRYMRDAILSATGVSLRGVTTVFEYTLLGAAMTGLLAGGLGSTSTLNSPAIADQAVPSIAVSALASSSSLAAPALADAGAESMAAGGLASSSTLQSPGLSEQSSDTLNVGPLASSSSLSAPALTEIPSIDAGGLASVSTLSAPTLSPQSNDSLAAGGLASTSSLSAPNFFELSNGLIRAYKLEDLTDEEGNADLSSLGSPSTATGKDGNGFDYFGSNSAHVTDWFPTGTFSISAWLNADSISSTQGTTGCNDGADHRAYLGFANSDECLFGVGDAFLYVDTVTISTGTWYHLVVTFDGATAKLYLDGTEIGSISASFSGSSSVPFAIGRRNEQSTWFNGLIDEVYIWDRSLSAGEADALYNSGTGLFF